MNSQRDKTDNARRCGYTLLEMMLTMGLLVVMAGLTWPALRGPINNQRLRAAAKQVRIELAKARLQAMESAERYELRYVPETNRFYVGPKQSAESLDQPAENEWDFNRTASDAATANQSDSTDAFMLQLPKGVTFTVEEPGELEDQALATTPDDDAIDGDALGGGEMLDSEDESWSEPILFQPDGTTTPARLVLRNDQENYVVLELRGLTGVITVSQMLSVKDIP